MGGPDIEVTLSSVFWRLVKSLGVVDVMQVNKGSGSPKSGGRVVFTYDEIIEHHERFLSPEEGEKASTWSTQSTELKTFLYEEKHTLKDKISPKKGAAVAKRGRAFVYGFFKDLLLRERGLTVLDEKLRHFTSLTELNLSGNMLQSLQCLPANLEVLDAYTNRIATIAQTPSPPPLRHLGMGYNDLLDLGQLQQFAPTLISLDISFNSLTSLQETLEILQTFPKLKLLWLQGNPLSFAKFYRPAVLARLPDLLMLDGISTNDKGARQAKKESKGGDGTQTGANSARGKHAKKGKEKDNKGGAKKGKEDQERKEREQREEEERAEKEREARQLAARLAGTEEALSTEVALTIHIGSITGLQDPSTVLNGAGEPAAAGKKGKGGTSARGGWEEVRPNAIYKKRAEDEKTLENGDVLNIEVETVKDFSYFAQYRIADDTLHRSDPIYFHPEVTTVAYSNLLRFQPDVAWRDFAALSGVDFVLYQREETTTTTLTSTTHADPDTAKGGKSARPTKTPKSGKKKADSGVDAVKESATEVDTSVTVVGVAHYPLSALVSARDGADLAVVEVEATLAFQPCGDDTWMADPACLLRRLRQNSSVVEEGTSEPTTMTLKLALNSDRFDNIEAPADERIGSRKGKR